MVWRRWNAYEKAVSELSFVDKVGRYNNSPLLINHTVPDNHSVVVIDLLLVTVIYESKTINILLTENYHLTRAVHLMVTKLL